MAAVPGSLFRRMLFWSHLTAGVAAGIFIFVMAATGVLLSYEHQLIDVAARANTQPVPAGAEMKTADDLARIARGAATSTVAMNLIFVNDPGAPVIATRGREGSILLNPYTGAVIPDAAAGMRGFFRVVENWHRRMGGEGSSIRALLIDYGNLFFLFIVTSGIYIWLPKVWRWRNFSALILFKKKYVNSKVRDFMWHHVFAFWMLAPLFLISLSGVVMSFPWANKLVYAAYGEEPPQRRGPPDGAGLIAQPAGAAAAVRNTGEGRTVRDAEGAGTRSAEGAERQRASLEALRLAAVGQVPQWQRLTLPMAGRGRSVEINVELKSDQPRPPRQTITFNAAEGAIERVGPVQSTGTQSPAQRARSWLRMVHTGEQYGIAGQTIAGAASLAACFLVYTGLALAYRRLLKPLLRRRDNSMRLPAIVQD